MKPVSLKDALRGTIRKPEEVLLTGVLAPEPHDESMIRLYPNAASGSRYYLIPVNSVTTVHELEEQELLHSGIIGQKIYQVVVNSFTKMKHVTVTLVEARELGALAGCCGQYCVATGSTGCLQSPSCGTECNCTVDLNSPSCSGSPGYPHLKRCHS